MAHQLNTKKDAAVVIGGVNMDIWGRPTGALIMGDSCPGSVRMTPGGVGRNIAHNLRLLGTEVCFVTAMGDDLLGRALMDSCEALGFHMEHTLVKAGGHSSTYLFLTEAGGEMCAAINDMDICAALTPAFFESLLPKLKGYGAMVLDTNLPAESLAWLCNRARMPVYADTVSAAKAERLRPHLKRLRALKTNVLEAAALSGEKDPERAAEKLARLCPGRIFVSLGPDGMIAAERGKLHYLPAYETEVINTTGAGDAAAAAIVWADLRGFDLVSCAQFAQLAGSITCRSAHANNPDLATLPQMM
ncbi:MAG: MarR family transcriptional regulator [Oscillospiraceae bacterium]|nr:MarR family transcriptional regulator [Oscillospiraceae bacterium]